MFVKIGGIEQWVTIKGSDGANPVVLFLHGGPGDTVTPYADAMFKGWDKNVTLVQWDQRGAGRTFGKSGPSIASTLTVDRMTDDGIQLAAYLTKHLGKKKIILMGGSWGSILGVHMVHSRPDLFYAWIGMAQVVNMREAIAASYTHVLERARASGNRQAVKALTGIGPPSWDKFAKVRVYHKWEAFYREKTATAPSPPIAISPEYASTKERAQYQAGEDLSFERFFGFTMTGPIMKEDIRAMGTTFAVPVFVIEGAEDLTAPSELAKAWFDQLKAPRKQFYLLPGTGHEPSAAELNLARKIVTEQVRPLALDR